MAYVVRKEAMTQDNQDHSHVGSHIATSMALNKKTLRQYLAEAGEHEAIARLSKHPDKEGLDKTCSGIDDGLLSHFRFAVDYLFIRNLLNKYQR